MAVHYLNLSQQPSLIHHKKKHNKFTSFNRTELHLILSVYGKKVSQGIWKDYAIDHFSNSAVFSFYRNSFEKAYLQLKKNNKKSNHRYCLSNSIGRVLKQHNELNNIIGYLNKSHFKVVEK